MLTHVQLPNATRKVSLSHPSVQTLLQCLHSHPCAFLFLWKWYTWGFLEMNCACDRFQFPCHLECRIPSLQADLEWVLCFCVYKPEKTHGYQSLGFLMSTHTHWYIQQHVGAVLTHTHTHAHTSHHTLHWKKWLREKTLSATPRGRTSVSTTLDPTLNRFSYTPPLPPLPRRKKNTHAPDRQETFFTQNNFT